MPNLESRWWSTVTLLSGFHDYHVRVPRRRLRVGRNELVLRYGNRGNEVPWAGDSVRRSPAVAWQRIRIGSEFAFGSVRADSQALEIPFHTRVDYFVDVKAGAKLRWERVVPWGVAPGQAAPTLHADVFYEGSSTPTRVAVLTGTDLAAPFSAALDSHGVARVSFLALPAPGTPERASGLRILQPALTAPAGIGSPKPNGAEVGDVVQPASEVLSPTEDVAKSLPAGLGAALRASPPAERPPNVIIYLVDTLRADHLGTYGYGRPTSPSLDAMSLESVVFDHAMAQSGWTRTSVASILTGLQPRVHDVLGRLDALSVEAVTLPGLLKKRGYQTHAVVTNGNVSTPFGFENGFDSFVYVPDWAPSQPLVSAQLSGRVDDAFFEWLSQRQTDKPFFAYLHADDPHKPYTPSEPYLSRFRRDSRMPYLPDPNLIVEAFEQMPDLSMTDAVAALVDLYDAEIAHNDAQSGRLLDHLRELGIYDSTLILFVSDHGEEFFEHGSFEHGQTLYSELIFVPLVIKFPGGWAAGTRVDAPVQHVDILPTILDLVGVPPPPGSAGDSLLPVISTAQEGTEDERFATRRLVAYIELDRHRVDSLLTGSHHLIERYPGAPGVDQTARMFRWRTDPREQVEVSGQSPALAGYLQLVMHARASSQQSLLESEDAVIDAELASRLRALGYLQ